MAKQKIALPGMVYERLTVIGDAPPHMQQKCKGSDILIPTRMVECLCRCGQNIVARATHLSSGKIKSCGCYNNERIRQKHSLKSVLQRSIKRTIYTPIEIAAKRFIGQIHSYKDIANDIDINPQNLLLYVDIMERHCFYCKSPPTQKKLIPKKISTQKYWIHNGMDAINPILPHSLSNIVSCCKKCNYSKSDMQVIEFYNHIHLMNEYRYENYDGRYTTNILPIDMNKEWNNIDDISAFENRQYDLYVGAIVGKLTLIERILVMRKNGKRGACWKCRCTCGASTSVRELGLKQGLSLSCGGAGCRIKRRKYLPINYVLNNVYRSYERMDIKKNREFSIDLDTFKTLSQINCVYCGLEPQNATIDKPSGDVIKYNGLDRIDSRLGHIDSNIVPCCWMCNGIKLAQSLCEFDDYIDLLYSKSNTWLER